MFCGVTAAQIGIATASETDRGTATAIYFSAYYAAARPAATCPGWPGRRGRGRASWPSRWPACSPALALLAAHRAPAPVRVPA